MSVWVAIFVMLAGIYAVRSGGMLVSDAQRIERGAVVLEYLPAAILGALLVSTLLGQEGALATNIVVVIVAGLVGFITRRGWLCIVAGLALLWIVQIG